eukprot:2535422-Pyramimonas_sp.AAC.1
MAYRWLQTGNEPKVLPASQEVRGSPTHMYHYRLIEEVWKRESQAENEKKKIEELQKQIEDERKQEEMMGVASSAGIVSRTERLEFMYRGGVMQTATTQPEVVQTGDDTMNQPFQMKEDDKKMKK